MKDLKKEKRRKTTLLETLSQGGSADYNWNR